MLASPASDPIAGPEGGDDIGGGTGVEMGADAWKGEGEDKGEDEGKGGAEKLSGGAPNDIGGTGGAFGAGAPGLLGMFGRLIRTDVSAFSIPVSSSSSSSCGLPIIGCARVAVSSAELGGAAYAGLAGGGAGVRASAGGGAGVWANGGAMFFGSCWPGAVGASDIDGSIGRFIASVGCVESSRAVPRSFPGFVAGAGWLCCALGGNATVCCPNASCGCAAGCCSE
jgi:hypothetical protein